MIRDRSRTTKWLLMGAAVVVTGILSGTAHAAHDEEWRSGSSAQLTGRVRSLDRNDTTFVVDRNSDNRRVTVRAGDALITNRNDTGRARFRLSDLRQGEVVDVFGSWVNQDTLRATRVERSHLIARDSRNDRRDGDNRRDRGNRRDRDDRRERDNVRRGPRDPWDRDRGDRDNRRDRESQWGREGRTRDGLIGIVNGTTGNLTRTLQVQADRRSYSVEVPRNIVVYRDGRSVSVHEIRENDRIRIQGEWRNDRLRAEMVEASSSDRFDDDRDRLRRTHTGVVERLDRRDERFRLRTSSRTYEVDARDADVLNGTRRSRFSDLREGDRVTVYASEERGSRLRADRIQMNDRLGRDDDPFDRDDRFGRVTLGGTVTSLDTYNRTFRLRMSSLGSTLVRVASSTDVRDRNGRTVSFTSLRSGDRVRVIGARRGNSGVMTAERVELYY